MMQFTEVDKKVLKQIARGNTHREAAIVLEMSETAIRKHVVKMMKMSNSYNSIAMVVYYLKNKTINLEEL